MISSLKGYIFKPAKKIFSTSLRNRRLLSQILLFLCLKIFNNFPLHLKQNPSFWRWLIDMIYSPAPSLTLSQIILLTCHLLPLCSSLFLEYAQLLLVLKAFCTQLLPQPETGFSHAVQIFEWLSLLSLSLKKHSQEDILWILYFSIQYLSLSDIFCYLYVICQSSPPH